VPRSILSWSEGHLAGCFTCSKYRGPPGGAALLGDRRPPGWEPGYGLFAQLNAIEADMRRLCHPSPRAG